MPEPPKAWRETSLSLRDAVPKPLVGKEGGIADDSACRLVVMLECLMVEGRALGRASEENA